jgi:hypothetical protein
MCRSGRCDISYGTDATSSMDIIVLWGRGFTASYPLRDIHKPNPKISETEVMYGLGHFYHKIYYYSLDNRDMMFFLSFLKSCCSWFEVLPSFSHYATFPSVFPKVVRFRCFALLVVSVTASYKSVEIWCNASLLSSKTRNASRPQKSFQ